MSRRLLGASIAFAMLFSAPASAETIPARLGGVVRDLHRVPLAAATITLREQSTGAILTTTSDRRGEFDFPAVHPGIFTLRADRAGFVSISVLDILITVGARVTR